MYEPYVYPYNAQNMPKFNAQGVFMQKQEVVRVNGENGARAYNLAPNSSVLMLDTTAPRVWFKFTDGAGYATMQGFDTTPMETAEEKNLTKLDEIEKRLSAIEGELKNVKSDVVNAEQQQNDGNSPTIITV